MEMKFVTIFNCVNNFNIISYTDNPDTFTCYNTIYIYNLYIKSIILDEFISIFI